MHFFTHPVFYFHFSKAMKIQRPVDQFTCTSAELQLYVAAFAIITFGVVVETILLLWISSKYMLTSGGGVP